MTENSINFADLIRDLVDERINERFAEIFGGIATNGAMLSKEEMRLQPERKFHIKKVTLRRTNPILLAMRKLNLDFPAVLQRTQITKPTLRKYIRRGSRHSTSSLQKLATLRADLPAAVMDWTRCMINE